MQNRARTWGALALVAISGLPYPAIAQEGGALTSEQISALVQGKRIAATRPDGASVRLRFGADGALSVQDGHAVDSGKWTVQGGKLCLTVPRWSYDGCGTVLQSDGKIRHYYPDGQRVNLVLD